MAVAGAMMLLAAVPYGAAAAVVGATITVNSAADDDPPAADANCTLREAIIAANTNTATDACPAGTTSLDTIKFDGTVTSITTLPGTPLPAITAPVIIDGEVTGQPGVTLVGPGGADTGLQFNPGSKGSTLKGLKIVSYSTGVNLGGGGVTLTNNWLGTADGATTSSNIFGVMVASSGNRIGLPGAAHNLISGNNIGMYVSGPKTVIQNNWVGLNSAGTAALAAPGSIGISISGAGNLIGGTQPGQGNVVSGVSQGIYLTGGASMTKVQRNFIGTNADGTAAVGINTGIVDDASQGTLIGGPMPAASNLFVGTVGPGIEFSDNPASTKSFSTVTGNIFGLSTAGLPLPNGWAFRFDLPNASHKFKINGNLITNTNFDAFAVTNIFSPNLTGSTNNCITGSGAGFAVTTPSTSITFKNNWWGDPTGPGGVYPGLGDTVNTTLVVANPFLKTPPSSCLGWAPRSYKPANNAFANASTKPTKLSSATVPTASTYAINISVNPDVSAPFDGDDQLSSPSFITGAPLGYGRYYWQVITDVPDTGQSWEGPINVYYVTLHKSPKPGAVVKPGNVKFTWAKQTGALVYQLHWFNNATCAGPGTIVTPINGLMTTVSGLTAGDYSWQVTATDIAGSAMPCWSFKVGP